MVCSSSTPPHCVYVASQAHRMGAPQSAGPRDCVWPHVQDGYDDLPLWRKWRETTESGEVRVWFKAGLVTNPLLIPNCCWLGMTMWPHSQVYAGWKHSLVPRIWDKGRHSLSSRIWDKGQCSLIPGLAWVWDKGQHSLNPGLAWLWDKEQRSLIPGLAWVWGKGQHSFIPSFGWVLKCKPL